MRRSTLAAGVLVTVAVLAAVVARTANGSPEPTTTTPVASGRPSPTASPRPDVSQPGAPDLDGARHAAIQAVALTGEVVAAGFISRRDLIARFTTPDFGPRLADATSIQLTGLITELGQHDADPAKLAVLEQPITAVATPTATGAHVQVWSVLIVAVPGSGPARQSWQTVVLEMVAPDGRWLVDGWESRPGPTPGLALDVRLDPADDVTQHARWPPAVSSRVGGG